MKFFATLLLAFNNQGLELKILLIFWEKEMEKFICTQKLNFYITYVIGVYLPVNIGTSAYFTYNHMEEKSANVNKSFTFKELVRRSAGTFHS